MQAIQQSKQSPQPPIYESNLLNLIAQWPDWKLQALCLDESDLEIMKAIQHQRQLQHRQ